MSTIADNVLRVSARIDAAARAVQRDPASITLIGLNGNRILASGNALWEGPNAANGQVHTGEIDGIGSLRGTQAVFELDGCSATLVLEAQGLAVLEESGCGGLNVSFVGRYRREK